MCEENINCIDETVAQHFNIYKHTKDSCQEVKIILNMTLIKFKFKYLIKNEATELHTFQTKIGELRIKSRFVPIKQDYD